MKNGNAMEQQSSYETKIKQPHVRWWCRFFYNVTHSSLRRRPQTITQQKTQTFFEEFGLFSQLNFGILWRIYVVIFLLSIGSLAVLFLNMILLFYGKPILKAKQTLK